MTNTSISTATIPIVFFGRLEERKGLCTFLEALRLLHPDLQQQLRITFMGKVVPLYSEALRHLTSEVYIQQELGSDIAYEICSDLFSQEAIQRVRDLNPIVCLTSPQENFPNSALEMGQVPVSLVVSRTGGFEETLALVRRTEGIYWFTPGDGASLAVALRDAIAHYPQTYAVATRADLEQINSALLEQKLRHIEQAFQSRVLPVPTGHITVGIACAVPTPPLLETLQSLQGQGDAPHNILVFHGEPQAESQAAILEQARMQFPAVRLVPLGHSVNLGAAWNQMASLSQGDHCLLLEPGWILLPGALGALMIAARTSGAVVVACPRWNVGEQEEMVTFSGGALPTLIRGTQSGNLPVLVSRDFLLRYPLPEGRDLSIPGWVVLAGAIATGTTPVSYPYPLVQSHHPLEAGLSGLSQPKQQYFLRQYLAHIPPAAWSPRQLYMVLTALQHLNEGSQRRMQAQRMEQAHQRMEEVQQQLHEARLKVHRLHKRLTRQNHELEAAQIRIQEMEGSKIWRIQQAWQKLKRSLGFNGDA